MKRDAFSCCHPAVNFIFFVGALGFGMVIQHPAFLPVGILASGIYYGLLRGWKGMLSFVPLLLLVAVLNPLFNRNGQHVLFHVFGGPYTLEALVYGAVLSGMFLTVLLWFGCFSAVITGEKFTSLFGNWIPALSLVLVMTFRMLPNLIRQGKQIVGARASIGKGLSEGSASEKTQNAATVLGCLTSWALEGSVATADSMRSRGYGTENRTSFQVYRMTVRDWVLLGVMALLGAVVIGVMAAGKTAATFTPQWYLAPIPWGGLWAYGAFLLIPVFLHIEEAIVWHISRSGI